MMFSLVCTRCAWQGEDQDINCCPNCEATIDIIYQDDRRSAQTGLPGLWRYAAYLPLKNLDHIVSLGEGNTPLLPSSSLGPRLELPSLSFKMEGTNPTGSYKDRIATVGISRLKELGKSAWAATSSGNAGAALAAYGARAGSKGFLFTLEKASKTKLAQILAYGPQTMAVQRLGHDPVVEQQTWANIRQRCMDQNWLMLVTARAFSPHAMEGAKTISYEVCDQLGGIAPDVVYIPVGGGGLLSASWKGFAEWYKAGHIKNLPRIVAVQSKGCDPVTQAWLNNGPLEPIRNCTSTISGLQLTAPPDGDLALKALHLSEGWAISIPDEETYQAQAELATEEGLFVEPAAAITLAAVKADLAAGRLQSAERVICWLTGIGFKDMNAVQNMTGSQKIQLIQADEILQVG